MRKLRYLTAALCAVVLLCGFTFPAYASGGEAWEDVETVTKEPVQTAEPTPAPTVEPTPGACRDAQPGAHACGIGHTRRQALHRNGGGKAGYFYACFHQWYGQQGHICGPHGQGPGGR